MFLDMSLLGQITENALTSDIEIEAEEGEVPNTFVTGVIIFSFLCSCSSYMWWSRHCYGCLCDRLFWLSRLS